MYMSEHAGFILSPLSDILREGNSACRGIGNEMGAFALSEYVMQTIFIKMTGALEQKMKCICWDMATKEYEYRYDYLNKKNYGECSDWKSKNGIYNDLIDNIQKLNSGFSPSSLVTADFLDRIINEVKAIFLHSDMSVWQHRQYVCFRDKYQETFRANQIGLDKQKGAKGYKLFESDLQKLFEKAVYLHRNRCAHNTLSYQNNKPELDSLAEDNGIYNNYFYRYALLILMDEVYIALFRKYVELQDDER